MGLKKSRRPALFSFVRSRAAFWRNSLNQIFMTEKVWAAIARVLAGGSISPDSHRYRAFTGARVMRMKKTKQTKR